MPACVSAEPQDGCTLTAPLVQTCPPFAQDVDESELTVEEAKERKIMKVRCVCVVCVRASCERREGWRKGRRERERERESAACASRSQLLCALLLPAGGRQPRRAVRLTGGHAAPDRRCCCCPSSLPHVARLLWSSLCSCCSRLRTERRRSASRPCASSRVRRGVLGWHGVVGNASALGSWPGPCLPGRRQNVAPWLGRHAVGCLPCKHAPRFRMQTIRAAFGTVPLLNQICCLALWHLVLTGCSLLRSAACRQGTRLWRGPAVQPDPAAADEPHAGGPGAPPAGQGEQEEVHGCRALPRVRLSESSWRDESRGAGPGAPCAVAVICC